MSVHLLVRCDDTMCRVALATMPETFLAETPLDTIPRMSNILDARNMPSGNLYDLGVSLYNALGGVTLRQRLDADDEQVLLLECDATASTIPWEYAASPRRVWLAVDYGMLRLVPRPARPTTAAPRLLVLCADPLLYEDGSQPRYQLDFDAEIRALQGVLEAAQNRPETRRIPPTRERLRDAFADGPALLHLSCHGSIVAVQEADGTTSQDVALVLEDDHGAQQILLGRDLMRAAPAGFLRMVLLSACQSAPLAQALVQDGIPVALGMQHTFPDPLSDDLVAGFYRFLFAGTTVSEAVRQARMRLADTSPASMGILVAYTCQQGWAAMPVPAGAPPIHLALPGMITLPENVIPPTIGLRGRSSELVALGKGLKESNVVTVVGAGGIGKTSLAAAFLRRFGWRFRRVLGVSFANAPVDEARVCRELIRQIGGQEALKALENERIQMEVLIAEHRRRLHQLEERAAREGIQTEPSVRNEIADIQEALAKLDPARSLSQHTQMLRTHLCDLVRAGDVILLDNYESVLTPEPGMEAAADAIRGLPILLLDRGASLLMTSRATPCDLPNERLIPDNRGMRGLAPDPAMEMFLALSNTQDRSLPAVHRRVARQVAELTDGDPLAIELLAAVYRDDEPEADAFLSRWKELLLDASKRGLDPRHARLATAVEFSLVALPAATRERLIQLAVFDFPFFAEGAALVWGLPADEDYTPTDEALELARQQVRLLVRRSLLLVDGYFNDASGNTTDQPATYRFQPALREELLRRQRERNSVPDGYVTYGAWLAARAYGNIGSDGALVHLVTRSWDVLNAASERLTGEQRLWHVRRIASLRQQFGELEQARSELEQALLEAPAEHAVRGALLYQLANIYRVQGELERAMGLYHESLAIHEALKDLQGKSATLHAMATIYTVQGELEQAMGLYRESLAITEALKDLQGKSATLSMMANIYTVQGELERAMGLYHESLAIHEALKDIKGKSATLHAMATIYTTQGELERAMGLYHESLAIDEALKDIKGKGATLHAMAYIYRVQGELERAMALYRESLAIHEALKDLQGKSATLHEMAYIYRVQGELERAMALYRESLAIHEALKDIKGKSATLSMMANIHMALQEWDVARTMLEEALALSQRIDDLSQIAFNTVKLGQLAQQQGDTDTARRCYQEGLAIHERLKMPRESQQVRAMLASLDESAAGVPLAEAISQWVASPADDHQRLQDLIALLNRIAGATIQILRAQNQPVAEHLASDLIPLRTALQHWPAAETVPPFNVFFGCLQALLRGQSEQLLRLRTRLDDGLAQALQQVEQQIAGTPPAQQAQLQQQARMQQIGQQAQQIAAATRTALASGDHAACLQLAEQLRQAADYYADGEAPGSDYDQLATFARACVALLRGEDVPVVAPAYQPLLRQVSGA